MTLQELVDVIKEKRGVAAFDVGGWVVAVEDADADLLEVVAATFDDENEVLVLLAGPKP